MGGRTVNRLTARFVDAATEPGRHADGGNLYLSISANGGKRWTLMYRQDGKQREMGLGSARDVTLKQARERASEARKLLAEGLDPLARRTANLAAERRVPTFGDVADDYVSAMADGWRNAKHRAQWSMTLGDAYCADLRKRQVDTISVEDVLAVLKPIWTTKAETASRIRGRIEAVLDSAKVRGFRTGENPAAWRGNLKLLLPPRRKLQRGHHAALPYAEIPTLMAKLRSADGVGAKALEFLILTASRTGEVIGARWSEFDLDGGLWVVPAERMKAGREHRVPLTERALAILDGMKAARLDDGEDAPVFRGLKEGAGLSNMSLSAVLKRLKYDAITTHGFRSSFRDWCGEETSHPRDVAEQALAHSVGNEVERAYRRGDSLEKRRILMIDWEYFTLGGGDKK